MNETTDRFCRGCGDELAIGNALCTTCGRPAEAAPAPETPEPAASTVAPVAAPSDERILAVIGNLTRVAGFMGLKQTTYTLVITERRLVFAELTKEKITAMVNAARDEAKAEGKGFFGQWGAQIGTSFNYHQAYWQMPPEAALGENPDNFAIERSAFQKAKFRHGAVDEEHNTPDKLVIKAASGTYTFNVNGALSAVKDAFRETGLA